MQGGASLAARGSAALLAQVQGEKQPLIESASVKSLPWTIAPICFLIIAASTEPYLMFSLYHSKLERTLGLSPSETGDIQSFGTLGGLCLAFVPGIVYDRYGFVVCLTTGGVLASSGALAWYLLLNDGGVPGSTVAGWHTLAGAFLILGAGTRFQFIAAVCAVLDAFPVEYAPRLSSLMSLFSAVGALVFPCIWKAWYLEKEALPVPESSPQHPHLHNVAHFHLMLVLVYVITTVAGVSMSPLVPRRNRSEPQPYSTRSAGVIMRPPFVCLCAISLLTLPVVYEYLGSAMAPLGKKALTAAGVTPHDVQQMQASMTTEVAVVALASRVVFGIAADWLTRRAAFASSALYILFFGTNLLALAGFFVILMGYVGPVVPVSVWETGTFLLASAFAGFFALLSGAVRTWFPRHELGTWLGAFLGIIGVCNFVYARMAAFTDFGIAFWEMAAAMSAVTCVTCGQFAYTTFKKDAERLATTPRSEVAGDTAA